MWSCGFSSFLVALLLGLAAPAFAEIEIDEYGSARTTSKKEWQHPFGGERRVGLGLASGGVAGIFAGLFELNFTEHTGLNAGFGFSTDYQSLYLGLKHILLGKELLPYVGGGYARWFSNTEQRDVGKTTPAFVGKRFLSDNERRTGRFAENLVYATIGLQYLQTQGEWRGSSVYAEVTGIVDVDDLVFEPNAGLGYIYYF